MKCVIKGRLVEARTIERQYGGAYDVEFEGETIRVFGDDGDCRTFPSDHIGPCTKEPDGWSGRGGGYRYFNGEIHLSLGNDLPCVLQEDGSFQTTYEICVGNKVRLRFVADFTDKDSDVEIEGYETTFAVADVPRPYLAIEAVIAWANGHRILLDDEQWCVKVA